MFPYLNQNNHKDIQTKSGSFKSDKSNYVLTPFVGLLRPLDPRPPTLPRYTFLLETLCDGVP